MKNRKILEEQSWKILETLIEAGFPSSMDDDSFREYSAKIEVEGIGIINLYYSPKKKGFKLGFHEIKEKTIRAEIKELLSSIDISVTEDGIYTNKGYEIDVDGSYFNSKTSYATIIRKNGKVIKELSGLVDTSKVKSSNQITGEMKAVIKAIDYCNENKIRKIRLYYDYNGLKYWAAGKWKANLVSTKYYQDFMSKQTINIEWIKVPSHTGIYWNERVDELAKSAITKTQK
ncbi:MAG: RNase H family protein [Ignavibacteria bacterium]